jgi:hypothetical protein
VKKRERLDPTHSAAPCARVRRSDFDSDVQKIAPDLPGWGERIRTRQGLASPGILFIGLLLLWKEPSNGRVPVASNP